MMKSAMKKVIGSLVGGVTVFALSAYVFQFAMGTTEAKMSMEEIKTLASEQFPGEVVEVEYDDNTYEIEIKTDTQSFELVLDATTGEILYLEEISVTDNVDDTIDEADDQKDDETNMSGASDAEEDETTDSTGSDDNQQPTTDSSEDAATGNDSTTQTKPNDNASDTVDKTPAVMINQGQARKIAREKTNNAKVVELELEKEDGKTYYQVELINDTHEFEVEIDAFTGKLIIIEMEKREELENKNDQVLSHEEIRQLVMKSYADFKVKEITLDDDKGQPVYDIELKNGRVEIDMTLDAVTGNVLDFEKDIEDDNDDD